MENKEQIDPTVETPEVAKTDIAAPESELQPKLGPEPDAENQLEGQELMDAIRRRRNTEAYKTDMAAMISVLKRPQKTYEFYK